MQKEFRQLYSVSYINQSQQTNDLSVRFIKPLMFQNQLDSKKIRIQKFTVNNTYVPVFIPKRMLPNDNYLYTLFHGPGYQASIGIPSNNIVIPESLKYWITITSKPSNPSPLSGIAFINQIPENPNIQKPYVPITDDIEYYTNEYYWFRDMTNFLTMLQNAINNLATALGITAPLNVPNSQFTIDLSSQGYTLYLNSGFLANYDISFNDELIKIFPFKSAPNTIASPLLKLRKLVYEGLIISNDNNSYKASSCDFYESTFPFSQLLVRSEDININPTQFIDNAVTNSNVPPQNPNAILLEFNIRTKQYNQIYDFWTYTNNEDSLWLNFKLEESSPSHHITLKFELKMRNGIVIPLKLRPEELLTMTFEMKFEI